MNTCYEEGTLRAYLDNELSTEEKEAVQDHISSCSSCQSQMRELNEINSKLQTIFTGSTSLVNTAEAFIKIQKNLTIGSSDYAITENTHGEKIVPIGGRIRHKRVWGSVAAAAVLVCLVLLPPVRAAADQFLQVFRAQSVVYVPVSQQRLEQLRNLNMKAGTLFVSQPQMVGTPGTQQSISSPDQASGLVGFTPVLPSLSQLPGQPGAPSLNVQGQQVYQFQVNVDAARQVLSLLGINDVKIPDSLGSQPIVAQLPPSFEAQYQDTDYTLNIIEGTSPEVNLPSDVNLSELGKAALELLGMNSQQADIMSRQIDWKSTMIFPFPENIDQIQQVNINGVEGVLMRNTDKSNTIGFSLYWVKDGHFYIINSRGGVIGQRDLVAIANTMN